MPHTLKIPTKQENIDIITKIFEDIPIMPLEFLEGLQTVLNYEITKRKTYSREALKYLTTKAEISKLILKTLTQDD